MLKLLLLISLLGAILAHPSNLELSEESGVNRYDANTDNQYHLFTRANPSVSQPLMPNNLPFLQLTNFDSTKNTFILIHGWNGTALSDVNTILVPAILAVEDANIIVVDWSEGGSSINYRRVIANCIASGRTVARFIKWINDVTGASPLQYHIIGHGFGGHQAGIVGRNLNGEIAYITGLNPTLVGWPGQPEKFQPNDGLYTEVIHTNYIYGYIEELAHVDFYPNAGISMPGCDTNSCDDLRSIYYFAESIATGGFEGKRCLSYATAVTSLCTLLPGTLSMGGLTPKIGSRGVYWLETNPLPPFSRELN